MGLRPVSAARCFRAATAALALASTQVRPALADESDNPLRAKSLFYDARLLVKSGYYSQACPRFEQSLQLNRGIGTEFNLAECLERIGQTERARSLYLDVADRARAAGQMDREQVARQRAAAVALPPAPVTAEAIVIVGTSPGASANAQAERGCADSPEAILLEESGSLAEAAAGVRALRRSAATLAAASPRDPRVQKVGRELTALEAQLAAAWGMAGQIATQLALRARAAHERASPPEASAPFAPSSADRRAAAKGTRVHGAH